MKIIHEKELQKELDLDKLFTYYRDVYDSIKNHYVLYNEGDLILTQDLFFDWEKGWNVQDIKWLREVFNFEPEVFHKEYELAALVVKGNLIVNGSIINTNGDEGTNLLVTGNVKARNLLAGGSAILINGNVEIEECAYAYYNAGMLIIEGELQCPVVLNYDHHFEVGKIVAEYENEEYIGSDEEFPKKLKKLLKKEIKSWEDIFEELKIGNSILKRSIHTLIIDEQYYLDRAKNLSLKKVPEEARTKKICDLYFEADPRNLKFIPKEFITYELCIQAINKKDNEDTKNRGYPEMLSYVPLKFRTEELCRLYIKNCKGIYVFNQIPKKIKSWELCMEAARFAVIKMEDLPEKLSQDKELILEIIRNNGYQIKYVPKKMFKNDQVFLESVLEAGIIGGGFEEVEDFLEYKIEKPEFLNNTVIKQAIEYNISVIDKIPGYIISKELAEYADSLYKDLPEWETIKQRHSQEFWKYENIEWVEKNPEVKKKYQQYIQELEKDISRKERYKEAFEKVWMNFWTEEFLINCISYDEPDVSKIPESLFTKKLVEAILKYNDYGRYTDRLSESVKQMMNSLL